MTHRNVWDAVLRYLSARLAGEDFRRWFGATTYASDSGDSITVWVPTEAIRRHISLHFREDIDRALAAAGRADTSVRLVVAGEDDEEEDED
jgi:chromosomal replication initiation ATPase DnaA